MMTTRVERKPQHLHTYLSHSKSIGWYSTMCFFVVVITLTPFCLPARATPPATCTPVSDQTPRFRQVTADFGGGWTWAQHGAMVTGVNFRGGGGLRLSPQAKPYDDNGTPLCVRHWSVYLVGEFIFDQSGLSGGAVKQAIQLNPQNLGLSTATSATARYYSLTVDPTFRYCVYKCSVTVYGLGGFGWLHRNAEFRGSPTQGSPIGLPNPAVASFSYDSPAYVAAVGVTLGPVKFTSGLTYYIEIRRLQGLGINSDSTLWPMSLGIRW
jgi:hypothetical protein